MASAFQALPPPGPPPPGVVYPTTTVTNQPSSHSNGSFGMVFIVLAIILVVSALACVLGRLCNKRSQRGSNQPRPNNNNNHNNNKYHNHGPGPRFGPDDHMSRNLPPNGRANERDRDVEFGFGPNELGFDRKAPSHHMPPNGRSKERDEEFGFGPNELAGFDKKIPKIKIVPREDGRGQMMMPPRDGEFGGHSMGNHMPRMMESPRNFR